MKATTQAHAPRPELLPKCVSGWHQMQKGQLFTDGDILLAAVPIKNRYEYEVIHISCDVDYFAVKDANGDSWGWEIEDVEFFVHLKGQLIVEPSPSSKEAK